jgi:hypothetical protein
MDAMPVMLVIWGVAVAAFIALMIYRAQLSRNETDQLFLSENTPQFERDEQESLQRRVRFIQPLCNGVGGLAALLTVAVVGIYVARLLPYMKF